MKAVRALRACVVDDVIISRHFLYRRFAFCCRRYLFAELLAVALAGRAAVVAVVVVVLVQVTRPAALSHFDVAIFR